MWRRKKELRNSKYSNPAKIQPFREPQEEDKTVEHVMAEAWMYIFGLQSVSVVIAQS